MLVFMLVLMMLVLRMLTLLVMFFMRPLPVLHTAAPRVGRVRITQALQSLKGGLRTVGEQDKFTVPGSTSCQPCSITAEARYLRLS